MMKFTQIDVLHLDPCFLGFLLGQGPGWIHFCHPISDLLDDAPQVLDAVSAVELDLEGQLARLIDPKLALAAREERKFHGNSQEKLHDLLSLKCHALKDFIPQQARNLEKKAKAADQTPKSSPTGAS